MEVLAITQVFERRVIGQYKRHSQIPELKNEVRETLDKIMEDEKWHLEWVGQALSSMEGEYGADHVKGTIKRYTDADKEVYLKTMSEHEERVKDLLQFKSK